MLTLNQDLTSYPSLLRAVCFRFEALKLQIWTDMVEITDTYPREGSHGIGQVTKKDTLTTIFTLLQDPVRRKQRWVRVRHGVDELTMSDNTWRLYQVHFTGLGFARRIISVILQPLWLILFASHHFYSRLKHLHSKKTKQKKKNHTVTGECNCLVLCCHLVVRAQEWGILFWHVQPALTPGQVCGHGHPSGSEHEDALQSRASAAEKPADQPRAHGLRHQVHGLLQRDLLEEKG